LEREFSRRFPPVGAFFCRHREIVAFQSLAQALLPAFAGDMDAIESFLGFERDTAVPLLSKWRQKSEHALVIVDQFEELFTLNPPEVQEAFATLLGRLVLEADVHVLLSLRDDFLFHCQKHDALSPVFSELTPLGTLSPSGLRRSGSRLCLRYRFEDEALVGRWLEVSHERFCRFWRSLRRDYGRNETARRDFSRERRIRRSAEWEEHSRSTRKRR
jgi:hypothetical protein